MASTTHRIALTDTAYTNVSNGNLNAALVVESGQHLRVIVAGTEPPADTPDYASVRGPGTSSVSAAVLSVANLAAEDELWARSDKGSGECVVIRGASTVTLGSAG